MVRRARRDHAPVIRATVIGLRLVLAGLFLWAGGVKASASQAFAVALAPFTFVPPELVPGLAIGLAWLEIGAGVLLLLPRIHEAGAALVAGLCTMFIAVLLWALANGIIVSCGCFGGDEPPSAARMWQAVFRDVGILAAAVAVIALPRLAAARGGNPRRGC
jgi:putative oxidoreductase